MRPALFCLSLAALLLAGCSSQPPAPTPAKKAVRPKDDTRRFPAANQVEAKVVDDHLFGHAFLPGGNLAHYKNGKQEYDLILIRTASPSDAALLLLDYKQKLTNSKVVPGFGGFFGQDGARPAFLFAKSEFLCGVIGLPEPDADAVARTFAARIQ
jgi:hypothetical protein